MEKSRYIIYKHKWYWWRIFYLTWIFDNYYSKKIGRKCSVNQQVAIEYNGEKNPVICDGCQILAGAKVISGVTLNDGCIVGANAVVTHDVPKNTIVGGVPARVIKYK